MHERDERKGNECDDTAKRKAYLERQCVGKSQHELDNEQHDDWVVYRQGIRAGTYNRDLRQRIRWRGRVIYQINRDNRRRQG